MKNVQTWQRKSLTLSQYVNFRNVSPWATANRIFRLPVSYRPKVIDLLDDADQFGDVGWSNVHVSYFEQALSKSGLSSNRRTLVRIRMLPLNMACQAVQAGEE